MPSIKKVQYLKITSSAYFLLMHALPHPGKIIDFHTGFMLNAFSWENKIKANNMIIFLGIIKQGL